MHILRRIGPCFFAIMIDALGYGLVYPVMAAMFTLSASPVVSPDTTVALRHFYLGLGYLLYPLFMFFGASFLGDLSDEWGRKKVLLVCMMGIAIGFALMALGVLVGSLWWLFIGRALTGLMAGSQPIAQAIIADLSDASNKARNMGLIALNYSVALALGPFLGGILSDSRLVSWFGYWTPFILAAILSLAAFFWLLNGFVDTSKVNPTAKISWLRPVHIFMEAFEHQSVKWLSIVFLLMQLGWSTYFQYLIVHMQYAFHYKTLEMGLLQGMFGVGAAIGLLVLVPVFTKFMSSRSLSILMFVLTGLGVLVCSFVPGQLAQWILAVYVSAVNCAAFAAMLTVFSDSVKESQQGWVMGISSAVIAAAWVLTGLASNLLTLFGAQGLIALGGVLLVAAGVVLKLKKQIKVSA
ncbi:MAG: MFS transporter [Coxiellaceae bacterium]|nr:MFS transporter [Coxiellaceae bacterium]